MPVWSSSPSRGDSTTLSEGIAGICDRIASSSNTMNNHNHNSNSHPPSVFRSLTFYLFALGTSSPHEYHHDVHLGQSACRLLAHINSSSSPSSPPQPTGAAAPLVVYNGESPSRCAQCEQWSWRIICDRCHASYCLACDQSRDVQFTEHDGKPRCSACDPTCIICNYTPPDDETCDDNGGGCGRPCCDTCMDQCAACDYLGLRRRLYCPDCLPGICRAIGCGKPLCSTHTDEGVHEAADNYSRLPGGAVCSYECHASVKHNTPLNTTNDENDDDDDEEGEEADHDEADAD